ncbi:MAG: hypothetical protein NVSMB21_17890 [Vulcanimicrobiaceae bacterium]
MIKRSIAAAALTLAAGIGGTSASAATVAPSFFFGGQQAGGQCSIPAATVQSLQDKLSQVAPLANGGLFTPSRMWSAVVDRSGRLCSVIVIGDAWPGSRAIAIAKAFTGNAFSNDALALSTTMLYTPTQPGGSLYGLNESNLFRTDAYGPVDAVGKINGGIITFGGGFALYQGGKVIGGLGVSGDTSCADHVIGYRMRRLAGLDQIPQGVGGDNITYPAAGAALSGFQQPHCSGGDIPPGSI